MQFQLPQGWTKRPGTRCAWIIAAIISLAHPVRSEPYHFGDTFRYKLSTIKKAVQVGEWDTYVTGYAWHLPYGYEAATRARLNETTWGGGFGKTIRDDDGDRHSVYMMAFSDSHYRPQLNVGYAWQRYWNPSRYFGLGAGYLAFLFSREDVSNYMPMPAMLPCASINFGRFEVLGVFVPRVSRDIKGDVFFIYLRLPHGGRPTR
jgi:lipid IVA palmitoyltransferase